jgi:CRISPR-associated protein Csx10
MAKYQLTITLLSETLIGNAEGFGATIDKDSVFDEAGLPYIPGKRIKGILREQADLYEKFGQNGSFKTDKLFGQEGMTDKNQDHLTVSNFFLPEYQENRSSLIELIKKGKITRSEVMEHFSALRMMTRIDQNGIAADTSLRTYRILKKGTSFSGLITFDIKWENDIRKIIAMSRRLGSSRNRGMGHVQCTLLPIN